MLVHQDGFRVLEFKIERKHCIAAATVGFPAAMRSLSQSEHAITELDGCKVSLSAFSIRVSNIVRRDG